MEWTRVILYFCSLLLRLLFVMGLGSKYHSSIRNHRMNTTTGGGSLIFGVWVVEMKNSSFVNDDEQYYYDDLYYDDCYEYNGEGGYSNVDISCL